MSGIDSMYYVHKHLTERDLPEQLAEECGELTHASLKLIRAKGYSSNITPKSEQEATEQLREEAIDVCMLLRILGCLPHRDTVEKSQKWERWESRLKAGHYKLRCKGEYNAYK